ADGGGGEAGVGGGGGGREGCLGGGRGRGAGGPAPLRGSDAGDRPRVVGALPPAARAGALARRSWSTGGRWALRGACGAGALHQLQLLQGTPRRARGSHGAGPCTIQGRRSPITGDFANF